MTEVVWPSTTAATSVLVDICHGRARGAGWWNDLKTGEPLTIETPRFVVEKLCLVHSEVSEAMEGHRKGLKDDKLPQFDMLTVELADAVIRICDMAGGFNLPLAQALEAKLQFNASRADHKPENRKAEQGKAF